MSVVLLADEWPTARKEHRCGVCLGTIGAGDRYRRQRLVDDDPYVFKAHALCDAAYWKAQRESGLFDDEFLEWSEVRPLVEQFFAAIAAPGTGAAGG